MMVEVATTSERDSLTVSGSRRRDISLGTITFDRRLSSWVADAAGQSRTCSSIESAAKFIDTVWQPITEIKVVQS